MMLSIEKLYNFIDSNLDVINSYVDMYSVNYVFEKMDYSSEIGYIQLYYTYKRITYFVLISRQLDIMTTLNGIYFTNLSIQLKRKYTTEIILND